MAHRVRYIEIAYDQDAETIDEDTLVKLIERFFCPEYADADVVPDDHECALVGVSCHTEEHTCSNCNTNHPCYEGETP